MRKANISAGLLISFIIHAGIIYWLVSFQHVPTPSKRLETVPINLSMFQPEPLPVLKAIQVASVLPTITEKTHLADNFAPLPVKKTTAKRRTIKAKRLQKKTVKAKRKTKVRKSKKRINKAKRRNKSRKSKKRITKAKQKTKVRKSKKRVTKTKQKTKTHKPRQRVKKTKRRTKSRKQQLAKTRVVKTTQKSKPKKQVTKVKPIRKVRPKVDKNKVRKAERAYRSRLNRLIAQKKIYPRRAKKMGQQGVVKVSFTVFANGRIKNVRISRSSGSRTLDKATRKLIQRISGLLPFGKLIKRKQWQFTVNVRYQLY